MTLNPASEQPPIFVYYFTYCGRPAADAERVLAHHCREVSASAENAYRDGEKLMAKLRPRPGSNLAPDCEIALGEPEARNGGWHLPLSWTATRTPRIFPKMAGELSIDPFGPEACQITFRGSYRPPFGAVGRAMDKALLLRIGENVVKVFVDELADGIEEWSHRPQGIET